MRNPTHWCALEQHLKQRGIGQEEGCAICDSFVFLSISVPILSHPYIVLDNNRPIAQCQAFDQPCRWPCWQIVRIIQVDTLPHATTPSIVHSLLHSRRLCEPMLQSVRPGLA